jgi:glycosyltransferase involved in cell wall biosynthesis
VLFVGRLSDQKNPLSLLRGWQQVNAAGEYRLLIAGEGPLESSLRRRAAELQLQGTEFLGVCRDLRGVYHRACALVLPSLSEGCSNALLEAMASGLCPIVTNIGGNSDVIVDGVNGRLVAPRNDQQLSEVLSQVLADREVRQRLATAARDYVVAHHDAQYVARQYLDLFVDMME